MHAHSQLAHRHETLLNCEERMLFVGVDRFARLRDCLAMLCLRRQGQIHQVVVMVDPHMQDGLHLHLVGLWVVSQHSLPWVQRSNGTFPALGGDRCPRRETT